FTRIPFPACPSEFDDLQVLVFSKKEPGNPRHCVLSCMLDDARAQALSHRGKNSKHPPVNREHEDGLASLIKVRRAEYDCLERDARGHVTGPRRKLPLKVAAKDYLFAESRRAHQHQEYPEFQSRLRKQKFRGYLQ